MYWHTYYYKIPLDRAEYNEKIKALIEVEEDNGFSNHVVVFGHTDEKVRGKISGDEFIFWRRSTFFGSLYPIFKGQFLKYRGDSFLRIRVRLNPVAGLLAAFLFTVPFGFLLPYLFGEGYKSTDEITFNVVGSIMLLFILQTVTIFGYYDLKHQTMEGLEQYLELEKVKIKVKK